MSEVVRNRDMNRPLKVISFMMIFFFIIGVFITMLGLFLFGGVETETLKSTVYYSTGSAALLALLGLAIFNWMINTGKMDYKKYGYLTVFGYDPDKSMVNDTPVERYMTISNIILFSILFALIMSLISATTQTAFVALPLTEYQVTETGKLILSAEPAASAETLVMLVIISLIAGFADWMIYKLKLPGWSRIIFLIMGSFLSMAIWIGIHFVRYGSNETNLFATAMFGFLGSLITFFSGTPLTWYIWHLFNNLFLKASELFSSDVVVLILGVSAALYGVSLIIFKLYKVISKTPRGTNA